MTTIIALMGVAILGLIAAVALLWWRTSHVLHQMAQNQRATQQEVDAQRIVIQRAKKPT